MHVVVETPPDPDMDATPVEIVERKGLGHPDSICDALAERLSRALSQFYRDEFGLVLHHNVNTVLLCGGAARHLADLTQYLAQKQAIADGIPEVAAVECRLVSRIGYPIGDPEVVDLLTPRASWRHWRGCRAAGECRRRCRTPRTSIDRCRSATTRPSHNHSSSR